jgi:adenosylmethionine-8-amino-7-oxononanoate aminotransferase
MKDYERVKPLEISGANGSYLHLANGQKVIDGISSWWCKSLGHNYPRLKEALDEQSSHFEHVMLGHATNDVIVRLSEKLCNLTPSLSKVFYASDGSSAVEIALKMSLHSRLIQGEQKKIKFIALKNGYHGETLGALSVSDLGQYKAPYKSLLFQPYFISDLPYISGNKDPLWFNCDSYWEKIEKQLEPYRENTTALILEPIIQGAGGMKIYSPDLLKKLRAWTKKHRIHLICDEIMTGIGRTGKMLACHHADIAPDMICLSKGLTGGYLPLSAVLTTNEIYEVFYNDYTPETSFLHSHTYCGNPLAARVALEVLTIFEEEPLCQKADKLGTQMLKDLQEIAQSTGMLTNVRGLGALVAADINHPDSAHHVSLEVFQKASQLGAFLRPLGKTLYWMPPINMRYSTLKKLKQITHDVVIFLKDK